MKPPMTRRDALRNLGLFIAGSPLLHSQFIPRDTHQRVPGLDEITSVFEFEPVARAKILRASYDYVTGGVEGEYTLRRNRKGFDWVTLIPHVVGGASSVDLSTEVLGQPMPSPIFISPSSGHQRLHAEGEKDTHRGATAAGVTMIVSYNSSFGTPEIAATAEGPLWQQLYIHRNLDAARERIDQAVESGCLAVCLTVDAQYSSLRERLTHNRHMNPPRSASRRNRRSRRGAFRPQELYRIRPESPDQSWEFLDVLRTWSDLPILVKGLLTAEDATLAVEHGADGIVVSNHGARYLGHTPSTIEVLPEIVDAVGGRIAILVDGGFRRGSDIFKALALGANAVSLGRPPLWGLGAFGATGTQRVLEILQAELALAMASAGCSRIDDIDRGMVMADFP
jgi:isopentenyl diphosphate isomerase/L-lactate dehydrogenase-like FMN-dependent dehydrogenase